MHSQHTEVVLQYMGLQAQQRNIVNKVLGDLKEGKQLVIVQHVLLKMVDQLDHHRSPEVEGERTIEGAVSTQLHLPRETHLPVYSTLRVVHISGHC